jgi:hypothetical protein
MTSGLYFLVILPELQKPSKVNSMDSIIKGALLGAVVTGVYDMTSMATLPNLGVKEGLTDQAPTFLKTLKNMDLSEVANASSYYNLYKLYMEEYKKPEKKEPSRKNQLMDTIKTGPPKEPGSLEEPVLGQTKTKKKRRLSSFNKSHPLATEMKKYVGIYNKNIK